MSGPRKAHSWLAAIVAVVALIAVNLSIFGFITSIPGMSITRPDPAPQEVAGPEEVPLPPPAAVVSAATPASNALAQISATLPTTIPGWVPTDNPTRKAGAPFGYTCGDQLTSATGATYSSSQRFRAGEEGAVVQVWVYGAGQGAAAFDTFYSKLRTCPTKDGLNPSAVKVSSPGTEALYATVAKGEGVGWLLWRHGDVLASVSVSSLNGVPDQRMVAALAVGVDAAITPNLAECVLGESVAADATRSPYGEATFAPLAVNHVVSSPTLAPLPDFPWTVPAVPEFDSTLGSTALTALAPPVAKLPTATPAPAPHPSALEVSVPVEDPIGPGCGWAFTGLTPPVFNAEKVAADAAMNYRASQRTLTAGAFREAVALAEQQYDRREYVVSEAAYNAYTAYKTALSEALAVEEAARLEAERLERIEQQRIAAEEAERLRLEQEEYDRLNPTPTPEPTPEPEPTVEPTPLPTPSPEPTPTPEPTPEPTPTPTPTPTPSPSPSTPPEPGTPPVTPPPGTQSSNGKVS